MKVLFDKIVVICTYVYLYVHILNFFHALRKFKKKVDDVMECNMYRYNYRVCMYIFFILFLNFEKLVSYVDRVKFSKFNFCFRNLLFEKMCCCVVDIITFYEFC